MWTALVVLTLASAAAAHAAGYCSTNTFPRRVPGMQFTKEPIPFEYGFEDKHKSIHCCAKGYRSIEWFKDGVAYPWPAGVSNLIQYPEAANQTLYTQRASRSDSGNYTCRVSNETHSHQHTIHLEVLEKPPDSAILQMFMSQDQWVEEGGAARLYCEALVGRSYLADAVRSLRWMKVWPNGTDTQEGELLPSEREIKTTREQLEDILGAYLVIEHVAPSDYGKYVCVVNSNEVVAKSYVSIHYKADSASVYVFTIHEHAVPWRVLLLGAACAGALAATTLVLHRRCTPRLLLAARIAHARATAAATRARVLEKEFDVVVCWTPIDTGLVRGALLPTLTHKYKYRVLAVPLDADPGSDSWYNRLSAEAARGRALAAVVSPTQHSAGQLLAALSQLHALSLQPVVILLQDLPKLKREAKDANGDCLVSYLRRTRLLAWRHVHERAFWTALRLALPLPPHHTSDKHLPQESDVKVDLEDKNSDLEDKNSRSCSLTALV